MPPVRRGNSSQPAEDDAGLDDSQIDPATGEHIPRPRNAWILYRKDRLAELRAANTERTPMSDASKIISKMWKEAPPSVRTFYETKADQEKADHARKYPNYRFCPKSKAQKAAAAIKKRAAAKSSRAPKHRSRTSSATLAAVRNASGTFHTSTQVPYYAAAMLNQGLSTAVACAPEGPSPPLSLASTPVSTPSPFPSSDFEQGSSTTGTSPQNSPASTSGLGLRPGHGRVQHFEFETQTEASRDATRRVPPRLPSRPRSRKDLGHGAATGDATTLPSAVHLDADAAPAALSPLPWVLPESGQPSSHVPSRNPSPSNLLLSDSHDQLYSTEGMFEPVPLDSDPDPIDMNYPLQGMSELEAYDWTSLMGTGFDSISSEGIYTLPSGPFQGVAPPVIDVNMAQAYGLSLQHDQLSTALAMFDFSGIIPPNPPLPLAGEGSQQQPLSEHVWDINEVIHDSGDGLPSSTVLATNDLPAPYESTQLDQPTAQSSDYMTGVEEEVSQHVAQLLPGQNSVDPRFPPEYRNDPEFQDVFQIYMARKAQVKAPSSTSPSYTEPFYTTHNYEEEVAAHRSFSEQSAAPEPAHESSASASTYVPPSGAVNSHMRRVGGAWRPPVAQTPETVSQAPDYNRVPSWGSVTSA